MGDPRDPANGREGIADLPGERTQEIQTRIPRPPIDPAEAGALADADTRADALTFEADEPPGPVPVYREDGAPPPSSSDLASGSRRERRRQRDRRAELRAIQVLVAVFVGAGGAALLAVNLLLDDPVAPPVPPASSKPSAATPAQAEVPPPPPSDVVSTPFVETVDLPALRQLANEGLTVVAEGLPAVSASDAAPPALAARETCRFAYGVWELSPNRRFRFMPTCPPMDGQVLFGAYTVQGGIVRMSPLTVSGVELVSEFWVEKPSRMLTRVTVAGGQHTLQVRQRVTVIRAGQFGDAFFATYAPKNTLSVPGRSARRPPPSEPRAPAADKDPLLDLLRGGR